MTDIKSWSITASQNGNPVPDGFPEQMAPSGVNDSAREVMAAVRRQWNDAEWFDYGSGDKSPLYSFVSSTVVKVVGGAGAVSEYQAGRRVKYVGAATIYGTILSSATNAADLDVTVSWDSGNAVDESFVLFLHILRSNNSGLPQSAREFNRNHVAGLVLSNSSIDADHDIDISAGECRDDVNSENMELPLTLVKRIDASWSVGSGNGGLDTGAVAANTSYAVWLIKRTDMNVVDALFSTSFTSPTTPADYDKKRLIGWVVTGISSNVVSFVQVGDYFRLLSPAQCFVDAIANSAGPDPFETGTIKCPPNCEAICYAFLNNQTAVDNDGGVMIRRKGSAESNIRSHATFVTDHAADYRASSFKFAELVDQNSQIEYKASASGGTFSFEVNIIACRMLTRSNP